MNNPLKAVIAAVLIFACGVLCGVFVVKPGLTSGRPETPVGLNDEKRVVFVNKLDHQLGLEAGQKARISEILTESNERTKTLWEPIADRMRGEIQSVRDRIRAELNPEQKEKFDRKISQPLRLISLPRKQPALEEDQRAAELAAKKKAEEEAKVKDIARKQAEQERARRDAERKKREAEERKRRQEQARKKQAELVAKKKAEEEAKQKDDLKLPPKKDPVEEARKAEEARKKREAAAERNRKRQQERAAAKRAADKKAADKKAAEKKAAEERAKAAAKPPPKPAPKKVEDKPKEEEPTKPRSIRSIRKLF